MRGQRAGKALSRETRKPLLAGGSHAPFHHAPRVQHRRIRTRGAVAAAQLTKRQLRLVNLEYRKETLTPDVQSTSTTLHTIGATW